ncbi:uncharacterized protein LOC100846791 [Brachypodium distachyon]|uniref:Uncharacterized protein n=1 Tax=Brachypodium distachyon TaxID=15368 RepID=I1GX70_BRADI|nr:uncharacterized protein LOC100846791 [Brachypodium distachyon]KQK17613.1 hypothetical protein BRADI_1g35690v3 [Brachypodium distachyon]|eukprot:XP_003563596.1 uncharacterized protein LOC100846791 [Brachypodium distachyon]
MGSGLSRTHRRSSVSPQQQQHSARVIAADSSLREFPASSSSSSSSSPVSVSDVLGGNAAAGLFFLCSSDALYFDAEVPALEGGELLRPGQIYFVLPKAMLGRPMSSADMAAMAVRASEALAARARARRGRGARKAVRVTPVLLGGEEGRVNEKLNERTLGESVRAVTAVDGPPGQAARSPVKRALSSIAED